MHIFGINDLENIFINEIICRIYDGEKIKLFSVNKYYNEKLRDIRKLVNEFYEEKYI
jgi:hypothetical protein